MSPEKAKIVMSDTILFPSAETEVEEGVRKAGLLSKSLQLR